MLNIKCVSALISMIVTSSVLGFVVVWGSLIGLLIK